MKLVVTPKAVASSRLGTGRKSGRHQVDHQRAVILDSAEALFLSRGLERTTMVDIAAKAGITKVTLYRYFSNRDEIAVEIRSRMLQRILSLSDPIDLPLSLESARVLAQTMIRNFDVLRDSYRFLGMFDAMYLDQSPDSDLVHWTKQAIAAHSKVEATPSDDPEVQRAFVILSSVIWFMEKVAIRGEVIIGTSGVSLRNHLQVFEEMIVSYIEHLLSSR